MVEHAVGLSSKSARNCAAQTILRFMRALNPQVMELDDYMHKLYDQLIIMSDFKLDIDNPYPTPPKTGQVRQNKPFHYHPANIRFRYYGKTLEAMIRKATEMPDGDKKNAYLNLITVQMKKSYYLWNADILSDDMVAEHLRILSDGKLVYNSYGNRSYDRGGYNKGYYNNGRDYNKGSYGNNGYNSNGYGNNGYNNGGYNSGYNNAQGNGEGYINRKPRYYNNDNKDNRSYQPNRFKKRPYQS